MKFTKTAIDGVVIVEPAVFGDHRGFFMESWSRRAFEDAGLFYDFVQDNHSRSTVKGTLRGIHFQKGDKAQAKLVRCVEGAVLDVAVDLRPASPTYKQWVAVELSAENKRQLEHRNTIDATAFARSQASSILFYSLGDSSPL